MLHVTGTVIRSSVTVTVTVSRNAKINGNGVQVTAGDSGNAHSVPECVATGITGHFELNLREFNQKRVQGQVSLNEISPLFKTGAD